MRQIIKRIVSWAPATWQQDLKRIHLRRQIRRHSFTGDEPEYFRLSDWVSSGDWVLDIGANIGHYTVRLSELVGEKGRVLAFEPIPESFELLAANVAYRKLRNITLLNVAASNRCSVVGMTVPKLDSGLNNFYMAHITEEQSMLQVMSVVIDELPIFESVKFVKIDAEGHELEVLEGMKELVKRDNPIIVVEDNSRDIVRFLSDLGYATEKLDSSPNLVFTPMDAKATL